MTTGELPPNGETELPPKGGDRLDAAIVYGILSVAVVPVIAAIGVWVYSYTSLGGDGEFWIGSLAIARNSTGCCVFPLSQVGCSRLEAYCLPFAALRQAEDRDQD